MRNVSFYLVACFIGLSILSYELHRRNTPEARARREEILAAHAQQWQAVASQINALPGFSVPAMHNTGVMRIVTTQTLSEHDARKFVIGVRERLGYEVMVRLVDDTGKMLATASLGGTDSGK